MPNLIITSGTLAGQVFSFSESVVIGRGQLSDIRLDETTVSRRHALIRPLGDGFELSDQDSVNGTRARGARLRAPVAIKDGDEIEFGEVKAIFRVTQSSEHPSLPSLQISAERSHRAASTAAGGSKIPTASAVAPGMRDLLSRLKLFCDLGALARQERSLRDQLDLALAAIFVAFPKLQHAAIYLPTAAADQLALIAQRSADSTPSDLRHAEAFIREALQQENGLNVVEDGVRDALAARLRVPSLPAAALALPLRAGSDLLGGLYLDSDSKTAWASADRELFNGIAGQLAWLISSQRGRAPERAIDAHDLALARRIQQRFLPQSTPPIVGYSIAESYRAARIIGGDYFDFFQYRDGRQGWVLADVSGKSVSGALYMARLSVQVRALARHMSGPTDLLGQLNKKLYLELEPGMYVTMLAAALESEQGVLEFASAGHPLPLLRIQNGEVNELPELQGLPLGAKPDSDFRSHRQSLVAGAIVLFYTDGLDQARNGKKELFGKKRIVETLSKCSDAQTAVEALLSTLARFTAGEALNDDLTLIALSRDH